MKTPPRPNAEPEAKANPEKDPPTLVRFSKPYTFEGQTYTEIDLSGMENLTTQDMVEAERYLNRTKVISSTPEMTIGYACSIAATASGMPVEFFERLPVREAVKVKACVRTSSLRSTPASIKDM